MRFEWDQAKNQRNVTERGIAFADAARIFEGPTVEALDTREDYGEDRFIAIGTASGIELVVVYAERRADTVRIISARRATAHERKAYWQAFPK
jgi:uncharacterized protein